MKLESRSPNLVLLSRIDWTIGRCHYAGRGRRERKVLAGEMEGGRQAVKFKG